MKYIKCVFRPHRRTEVIMYGATSRHIQPPTHCEEEACDTLSLIALFPGRCTITAITFLFPFLSFYLLRVLLSPPPVFPPSLLDLVARAAAPPQLPRLLVNLPPIIPAETLPNIAWRIIGHDSCRHRSHPSGNGAIVPILP